MSFSSFTPGVTVRLPTRPDWGLGRVQTAVGTLITVNFEHVGKQVINVAIVRLDIVDDA